ncbi:MurR/RpiR family transcriptional regulator [Roseibium limicola]|uniref:MurR/RpiR family transcriptional regulator n=1 Tax=Roseibium limicola TaxID=2816037 RepID=A0A939J5L2_9HYPH|nr:MurR/RpiR family transcriptional regulator [Roseibium limicola]MBO0344182.1 MurR/RpiR family transcriptional regulator [Roseibium limicola]
MVHHPFTNDLIARFDDLTTELQKAARYVIDNPRDVALLSMREQARRAGVQPATMMRLAKQHGYEGYDDVRAHYADAMREFTGGFATRGSAHAKRQKLEGDQALASNLLSAITRQIEALAAPDVLAEITSAARLLADARRVYCLGMRASHPISWQMHYILSLISDKSVLLDAIAGTGSDPIRHAGPEDVLFASSVSPYTQRTLDIATYAKSRNVRLVVLSDSPVSPLAKLSAHALIAATESPGFYHTMTPAFALAEVLAVLVAGYGGDQTLQALQSLDTYHSDFNTHATTRRVSLASEGRKIP